MSENEDRARACWGRMASVPPAESPLWAIAGGLFAIAITFDAMVEEARRDRRTAMAAKPPAKPKPKKRRRVSV